MSTSHILLVGGAVAVVVAVVVFGHQSKAVASTSARTALNKTYGKVIPIIPPGYRYNVATGQLEGVTNITTGKARF